MRVAFLPVLTMAILTAGATLARLDAAQRSVPECNEWRQCRDLALEAREHGRYETFHDLAWRTMQTGPPNDPAIMYLLARAQSLSNRSRDALIMLTRLANMGVVTDAATEGDFRRTRQLPGWKELEALVEKVTRAMAGAPAAAASPRVGPPPPAEALPVVPGTVSAAPPVASSGLRIEPRPVEEVARFSAETFVPGGLAYDAVSRRYLFADVLGRKLMVLGEGLDHTVDLVRAEGGGFHDVTALEIDVKRGDLWVASTARGQDGGAIHKLQLISGRAIAMFELPPEPRPVRLTDLAIAPGGAILVLDSATPRVLRLQPGTTTLEQMMPLDIAAPASIAAGDGRTAYVAHRDGILRLDPEIPTAVAVAAADGIGLGRFERIRMHGHSLVGAQVLPDGKRQIIQLELDGGGRTVTGARVIDASLDSHGGQTFVTVSGDSIYYLVAGEPEAPSASGARMIDVLVRRVRLP